MTLSFERVGCRGISQSDFVAALLDPQRPVPTGLRAWNGSDPSVRLAVHRNNVVASLVESLADTFRVVQQLVGPAFFRTMASLFVRHSPPRSPVLAHYGQDFPAFIAAFAPARCLPYLADVARLEAMRVTAHHAADARPVSEAAVCQALASGGRMGELLLVLHQSVRAFRSAHAVVTLWAAHQVDDDCIAPVDIDGPETVLVLRSGLDVLVLRAADGAVPFLAAVRRGLSLGDAAACALAAAPAFDLTATLSQLLAHGALTSLHLPDDG